MSAGHGCHCRSRWRALLLAPLCAWLSVGVPARAQAPQAAPDGVARLLEALEQAAIKGEAARYLDLVDTQPATIAAARSFAEANFGPGATRVVVKERDRSPLAGAPPGTAYRLAVDVFVEAGTRARLATWRLDVARRDATTDGSARWAITAQRTLSSFGPLYRLSIGEHQYAAKDFVIAAEDFELRLPQGTVFTANIAEGPTVLVLVGHGQMLFKPTPATEREQMRIFAGTDGLDTSFTAAFVRLSPSMVYRRVQGTLDERPADARDVKIAQQTFRDDNGKSFAMNLGDLSSDTWSLVPGSLDFLAEVHTRRFKTLTYAASSREAEDVSLFDRAERRNISVYTSRQKLAERGRFYSDNAFETYEVLRYDVDTSIDPGRQSIEGVAQLVVRTRADNTSSITLRLAETIDVRSAVSREHGRLIALRVRNQNTCILNLPEPVKKDTVLRLTIAYGGRLVPQFIDREAVTLDGPGQNPQDDQEPPAILEPSYLFSNRSYWYPQAEITAFATGVVRVKVPRTYWCVGSGDPEVVDAAGQARTFVFHVLQPIRYFSVLITRLLPVRSEAVGVKLADGDDGLELAGPRYRDITIHAFASPHMRGRATPMASRAIEILRFYAALTGDCPYPTLTLAVVERQLPGGHSPGFLAVVAEPVLTTPYSWRADPTNFSDFPEFFLAHELAHQWWGQAVGWKNYHEQWLSEGLSQYFAALYAERLYGKNVFDGIIGRMQDWAIKKSSEGPVYLGYRIGHVKRDSQLFRAVVYNKSAAVLHMLRRLLGDDAFFKGLRRFYGEWRFRQAGSDDLRLAMEKEGGVSLERFFERWIYGSRIPRLRFAWRTEPASDGRTVAVLRFEQAGELFDVPVTVTLGYADRPPMDVIVKVTGAVTEMRVPLEGSLQRVEANRDHAALAIIDR